MAWVNEHDSVHNLEHDHNHDVVDDHKDDNEESALLAAGSRHVLRQFVKGSADPRHDTCYN